jgi:choline-sulfatase
VSVSGVWERRDEITIRNELGREFACSENIDIQIGRVLDKLDEMGELANTYVFYTADHGMAIGRHGLQGKQNLYQHTWRVPFLAKGPGIPAGSRAAGNIYLLDVLATLCDLAGIEAPETNEGSASDRAGRQAGHGARRPVRRLLRRHQTRDASGQTGRLETDQVRCDGRPGARDPAISSGREPRRTARQHHDPAVIALTGNRPEPHQVNLADDPRYADSARGWRRCCWPKCGV